MVERVTAPSPITFLPYLSGERTPHNAPDAVGAFHGLRRDHGLPDMAQAVMEGVGYAFADCCAALETAGSLPKTVSVAGGGSRSETWLQMTADITGLTLKLPGSGSQGAALGAARLGLMASEAVTAETVLTPPQTERTFVPDHDLKDAYAAGFDMYRNIAAQSLQR